MIRELNSADQPIPAALWAAVETLADDDDTRAVRLGVKLQIALRSPATVQLLSDAAEYVDAARQTGHPLNILEAEEDLVRVLLTAGDLNGAASANADLRRTVRRHRWPRYVWSTELFESTLADLRHGPATAARAARHAMTIGVEHGVDDALNAFGLFQLSVAYRDGGLAKFEPTVRAATQSRSALPAWNAVLSAALIDSGDLVRARQELAKFVQFTSTDPKLFHHIGALFGIWTARRIGDDAVLERCLDWLLPWSGGLIIAGAGAACFGPADLALAGGLASLGDDRAPALAHAGRELLSANGATAWLGTSFPD